MGLSTLNVENYSCYNFQLLNHENAASLGSNISTIINFDTSCCQIELFAINLWWYIQDDVTALPVNESQYDIDFAFNSNVMYSGDNKPWITGADNVETIVLLKGWTPLNFYVNRINNILSMNLTGDIWMPAALVNNTTFKIKGSIFYRALPFGS